MGCLLQPHLYRPLEGPGAGVPLGLSILTTSQASGLAGLGGRPLKAAQARGVGKGVERLQRQTVLPRSRLHHPPRGPDTARPLPDRPGPSPDRGPLLGAEPGPPLPAGPMGGGVACTLPSLQALVGRGWPLPCGPHRCPPWRTPLLRSSRAGLGQSPRACPHLRAPALQVPWSIHL